MTGRLGRMGRGGAVAAAVLGLLAAATVPALASGGLGGTDGWGGAGADVEARLRAGGATGAVEPLVLTGAPRRSGDDVVLTLQVAGRPGDDPSGSGAAPRAVALDADDGRALTASAAVSGGTEAPQRAAVLVVDTSASMGGAGIDAARRAALGFAAAVDPSVPVGLVAFADEPRVVVPVTTDRARLRVGLGRLVARGETSLYDAVVAAAAQAGPRGDLVVLSDGRDTVSRAGLGAALAAVRAAGLRADVIAFRTAEGARGPLERIAAAGRGRVVQASDAAGLARAFAAAAVAVPLDVTVRVRCGSARRIVVGLAVGGRLTTGAVDVPALPAPVTPVEPVVPARPALPAVEHVVATPAWFSPSSIGGGLAVVLGLAVVAATWPRSAAELARRRRREVLDAYEPGGRSEPGGRGGSGSGDEPGGRDGPTNRSAVSAVAAGLLRLTERMVAAGGRRGSIELRLDRAGLTLLPHEWVALRGCVTLVGGAGGLVVVHPRALGLIIGAALAGALSGGWLKLRESRRCRAFAEQLPDTLQTVASSLRSGFSLQQALAATQETAGLPMSAELGRALAAARIGVVLEDELDQIAVRMRSDDWHLAVMAIRIQRSVGGNLSEVLGTTVRTLRERAAVVRQVRALSAEGRLSAYVLLALPVGVGLFLAAFRREYVEPLWSTPGGIVMLLVSAVGMTVGTIWMLKVAEVEV